MTIPTDKKIIAWGASKLLEIYRAHGGSAPFSYVVDSDTAKQGGEHCGLPVRGPYSLEAESPEKTIIVLFPVSNGALQSILGSLHPLGYRLDKNVFLYGDLFYESFLLDARTAIGTIPQADRYAFVKSFSLRTTVPVHTTLLGNVLFLELLAATAGESGSIAEVGSFSGGNALLSLLWLSARQDAPPYAVMDSFEGFPELSRFDPQNKKQGDYKVSESFQTVLDTFSAFPNARVVKGFVPESFAGLPNDARYRVVFYDCDLYDPARQTFEYFWDRIMPGGFLMIHDYIAEAGGYAGVKKATDEFFAGKAILHPVWQTLSAVVRKL